MTEHRGFRNLLSPANANDPKVSEDFLVKKEMNLLKDTNFLEN